MRTKLFLLFSLGILLSQVKSQSQDDLQCVLFNQKYQEYMYAANMMFSKYWNRAVYTFPLGIMYSLKNGHNFDFKEDDRKGVWLMEHVPNRPNVFYMKNLKYEEYMYAGDKVRAFLWIKSNSRHVLTQKNKVDNDESFMWRFEKQNSKSIYNIYNVKYKEPLYANSLSHKDEVRRDVLTWFKSADNTHFYWNVKCKNDRTLN